MSGHPQLPSAAEAEAGVLGCCLLDPKLCIDDTLEQLPNEEAFFDVRYQTIWHHILVLHNAGLAVDLVTLTTKLKDAGQLGGIGGLAFLSTIVDNTPSAANLSYYLAIVREKYLRRRMLEVNRDIAGKMLTTETECEKVLDECERDLMTLMAERAVPKESSAVEVMGLVMDRMDQMARGDAVLGIPMGIAPYLDKMTLGMEGGQMIVPASRPGMGKTSFGMQIVGHVAVDLKMPVVVFSLEMTKRELGSRLVFQRTGGNYQYFRTGFPKNEDLAPVTQEIAKISGAKLWIDDSGEQTVWQIRNKARRLHGQHGIRLILIDYLQLIKGDKEYRERRDEITAISKAIKSLAKELDVPIIVMAQLNRELERGPKRLPQMSDLRECGAIEQDADIVAALYQPWPRNKEEEMADEKAHWCLHSDRRNLLICKQRNGPTGCCELLFHKASMRFTPFIRAKEDREPEGYQQEEL